MAEELKIIIGAETKSLQKALKNSEKDVSNFAKSVNKGSGGIDKLGKSTANAVPSVTEFSRVIQDAPFGIQGVANNITQLTQQFGNLSKQAGGSRAALKAMLSTLSGPAGILLAVSAVTSLLVVYGDELNNTTKETNKLVDATKDLIGSAQSELAVFNSLLVVAQDTNKSLGERQRAINKLNEIGGEYLDNLTLENVSLETTKRSLDAYSESLIRNAKIKGLQNRLSELFAKRFEIENKALTEQLDLYDKGVLAVKNYFNTSDAASDGLARALENQKEALQDTDTEIKNLTNSLADIIAQDISLDGIFTSVKQASDKLKDNPVLVRIKPIFGDTPQAGTTGLLGELLTGFDGSLDAGLEKFRQVNAQVLEEALLFSDGVTSVFNSLGQNIANSLSQTSGVFGAFVGTIIQESLKLVSQLIANSIKGTAVTAAQTTKQIALNKAAATSGAIAAAAQTAAASGPGAAFLLPGLIAAAVAAIGAAFSGIGGGGSSGSVGGSGSVGNTSAVNTSFGSTGGNQRVVFEIAGRKLLGVLQNEVAGQFRINGGEFSLD